MNIKAMKNAQPPTTGPYTILYSVGYLNALIYSSKPLINWSRTLNDGEIKRVKDEDIQGSAIELIGSNVMANYIATPVDPKGKLGIQMPFMVLQVKNVRRE
eukprot:TRINITY_DN6198_c0_g1_i7.p1 TRINITY_DN6198_c0_g1~~TRINITY_DN6198_c0_g1_i7.p1  ORF type:complete len:101 (-),score=16.62 TRINITY_DN6198_c0_g1_i7:538-840(-)